MPKNSENLNLVLYSSTTDAAEHSKEWFEANFGYNDSNLMKIDAAYKAQQDKIDNTPTKSGTGATGTWDINISGSANSATHDGAGNDINSTYVSEISVEDTSITYTKGNGGFENLPFKTDKTLTKEGMIADAKATGDLIRKSVYPTLVVKVDAGSSITVSKDNYTFTGTTDQEGEVEFNLPVLGRWDIVATLGSKKVVDFVDVDVLARIYEVSMVYFAATLTVTSPATSMVTAVAGKYEYTKTASSAGAAVFSFDHAGEYSVSAVMNNAPSDVTTVEIREDGGNYTTTMEFYTITVTCDSGSAITVQKGEDILTGKSEGTPVKFYIPSSGTWTVSATLEDNLAQEDIEIITFKDYPVKLDYAKIFGVVWDYSKSSTALSRLTKAGDPNGYVNTDISTEPTAAVGTGSGSSPFDNYAPWNKMEEYNIVNNTVGAKFGDSGFSRSSNDVVVYIPEFWYKVSDSSNKRYFYIADKETSGFEKHPGSEKYVGRYNTISGNYSRTGSSPYVNMTRATARNGAKGKGNKWSLYDYSSWCAVWLLYIVEYADWNSQTKIGRGWVDGNNSAINSGGTDTMTYHTGRAAGTDGKTAVQYRHIENPWGNVFEWIDGVNFSDGAVYVCTDPSKYADNTTSNYTNIGTNYTISGYISGLRYLSSASWAFCISTANGSDSTYIPDYYSYGSGWRVLRVGGYWGDASYAGLFCFNANNASSGSPSNVGARLLFHP